MWPSRPLRLRLMGATCARRGSCRAEGVVEAVTTAHHRPGAPVYALIRIDGASQPMLHKLDAPVPVGARVTGVWREERVGAITDIEHFTAAS